MQKQQKTESTESALFFSILQICSTLFVVFLNYWTNYYMAVENHAVNYSTLFELWLASGWMINWEIVLVGCHIHFLSWIFMQSGA